MKQVLKVLILITLAGYILYRLSSATRAYNAFTATLVEIYQNRNVGYTDKMRIKYPRYYDYIEWIKTVTPDNAIIYQTDLEIPYGEPLWPSNNIQMNTAWLYPRRILPWQGLDTVTKEASLPTYIMIIDGFPRSDVKSSKVILLNENNTEIAGEYIHDNYPLTKLGLIKL